MDASNAIETGFRAWYLAMFVLGTASICLLCQGSGFWRRYRLPAVCLAATIAAIGVLMLTYFGVLFAIPSLASKPISYCPAEAAGLWAAVVVSCIGIALGVALLTRWRMSRL
jgi:hypothetical protein